MNSSHVIAREGNVTLASLLTRHCLCAEAAPDPANGEEAANAGTSPSSLFPPFFCFFFFEPSIVWADAPEEEVADGTHMDPSRRGLKPLAKTLLYFSIFLWSCITPNCLAVHTALHCIRRQYILLLDCLLPSWPLHYRKSFDSKQLFHIELY